MTGHRDDHSRYAHEHSFRKIAMRDGGRLTGGLVGKTARNMSDVTSRRSFGYITYCEKQNISMKNYEEIEKLESHLKMCVYTDTVILNLMINVDLRNARQITINRKCGKSNCVCDKMESR